MSKTRRGKGKRREVDTEPFVSSSDSQIQTKAYPTKTGILALPVELFDKILFEFEYATLDDFKQFARFSYIEDFKERENALRALSQTSKLLRTVCLPLLWERFQVVQRGQQDTGLRDKENAIYMEKASNSLMDTPHLAKLIK
ncbi:hypothetical protein C8Q75DRAFT_806196 [Abortiporus biennis]|nr:hypothetical protein C8Q75DRAFT_806196 [Abortiporus biennis]